MQATLDHARQHNNSTIDKALQQIIDDAIAVHQQPVEHTFSQVLAKKASATSSTASQIARQELEYSQLTASITTLDNNIKLAGDTYKNNSQQIKCGTRHTKTHAPNTTAQYKPSGRSKHGSSNNAPPYYTPRRRSNRHSSRPTGTCWTRPNHNQRTHQQYPTQRKHLYNKLETLRSYTSSTISHHTRQDYNKVHRNSAQDIPVYIRES